MPISNTTPINTYTGNGSTTAFTYNFKILAEEDIRVYDDGTLQTLTTHYTVSGVGDDVGGTVTFLVAPADGNEVRLERFTVQDRETDYTEGGALDSQTLDDDFDRSVAMIQELERRTIKIVPGTDFFDAGGNRIINVADPVDPQDAATKEYVSNVGVRVTEDDTDSGVLETKLLAGDNISLTVGNPGGNETYTAAVIDGSGSGLDADTVDGLEASVFLQNINAESIDELSDVVITTPADNEVLAYDSGTADWINQTAAEAGLATDTHTHDSRYYTEAEVDSLLAAKSDTSHIHDDRYYTETEADALFSLIGHDHVKADITDFSDADYVHIAATETITGAKRFDLQIGIKEIATPATPATGYGSLYAKSDGLLYWLDDAGTERDLTGAAAGGAGPLADLSDVTITLAESGDLLRYNGSAWVDFPETSLSITESQISDLGVYMETLSDDLTPVLSGNLTVGGNKIISVSNGDIDIEPNGTGNVLLGNFEFDADQSVGAGTDDYVLSYDDASGLISLEPTEEVVTWVPAAETISNIAVDAWIDRNAPAETFRDIVWSPELSIFVGVSFNGNHVMTSSDGITWISGSAPNRSWQSVAWSPELGLFAAVATSSASNDVMTSPDGITWTTRVEAEDNDWRKIVWSPELGIFVAIAQTGTNRVMTSPDGITWTSQLAAEANTWRNIAWSPELGLFAAISEDGTNQVMTSPDGITWTSRSAAAAATWRGIAWSPELGIFAAVADIITNGVMISYDGINWIGGNAAEANLWFDVAWAPELGLFAAVSFDGTNRVMTSPNGLNWTARLVSASPWQAIEWSSQLGVFAVVGNSVTMHSTRYNEQHQYITIDEWQLVEYADLTNGGANDLTSYEFSHTLEDGYTYVLQVLHLSSDTASWLPLMRVRNAAGTLINAAGNYKQSIGVMAVSETNNESRNAFVPYSIAQAAADFIFFNFELFSAANSSLVTTCFFGGYVRVAATNSIARTWGAGAINVAAEAHTGIVVGVGTGNMDSGEAYLYRIKLPA